MIFLFLILEVFVIVLVAQMVDNIRKMEQVGVLPLQQAACVSSY